MWYKTMIDYPDDDTSDFIVSYILMFPVIIQINYIFQKEISQYFKHKKEIRQF